MTSLKEVRPDATLEQSPPFMTREQMREVLLEDGVGRMIWHVGSDPSDPQVAFDEVVAREAVRSGFVSWTQGPTPPEGMNASIYYHPDLGLKLQDGKIYFDHAYEEALIAALTSPEGVDFHQDAAPGWKLVQEHGRTLRPRLLKTHLATPSCSEHVLDEGVIGWQTDIYRALVRGHLRAAREIAPVIVVSADDPSEPSLARFRANFEIMFRDEFDVDGRLVRAGEDVLRALHSCSGNYNPVEIMRTGAVDVVHWDAYRYGGGILQGGGPDVRRYVEEGGMLAWGGIPQSMDYLVDLARRLGFDDRFLEIRGLADYGPIADFLRENMPRAVDRMIASYSKWLRETSRETGVGQEVIRRQTFVSATCGYGANKVPPLREFSYDLGRNVVAAIHGE